MSSQPTAAAAGTIDIGGDLTVNRLGFGATRITGPGIWGEPPDWEQAKAALLRAVSLDVNFIDTADSYGPEVSEILIAETLYPYPDDLVIATKGGLVRPGPGRWEPDGRPEHLREACQDAERNRAVDEAAARHGVGPRQVVLAWLLARSPQIIPIPGSGSAGHVEANIASAALELSADEVAAITKGG